MFRALLMLAIGVGVVMVAVVMSALRDSSSNDDLLAVLDVPSLGDTGAAFLLDGSEPSPSDGQFIEKRA
jgi:hypothetical protein